MSTAQPLLDLLSRNAGFLTAHDLTGARLVFFAVALGVGIPLLPAVLSSSRRRASRWVAAAALTSAGALFVLLVLRRVSSVSALSPWLTLSVSAALGGVFAWMVMTRRRFRQFAGLLAIGVPVFPAVFLLNGSMRDLLIPPVPVAAELVTDLERRPIVFVLFDELPVSTLMTLDETVDGERFPGFAELAATSTWYRRATAPAPNTDHSVPGILTGTLPDEPGEPVVSRYPENLFLWLGSSGYELFVQQNHTRLCPVELCREIAPSPSRGEWLRRLAADTVVLLGHLVAPGRWVERLPAVDQSWEGFVPNRRRWRLGQQGFDVPSIVASFLRAIQPQPRDRLYYLHLNLPHVPWKFLPTGVEYGPVGQTLRPLGVTARGWTEDEWPTVQGYQQHVLQSMYADRVLQQVIAKVRTVGLWDEALVIVAADHGVTFWPGRSRRAVAADMVEDILEVPLFVKLPGQTEARVDDRPVQTLDLLDTVAEVLGARPPWATDGVSLLQAPAERDRFYIDLSQGPAAPQRVSVSAEGRRRTLERKTRLLGSGDIGRVYGIGPFPQLLGRRLEDVDVAPSPRRYRLLDPWALDDVDPGSAFVPARVWAELEEEPPPLLPLDATEGWLAVAVNGLLRAVTRPIERPPGRTVATAMVAQEAFIPGKNTVQLLEIESVDPPRLRRLESGSAAAVDLVRAGGDVVALAFRDGTQSGEERLLRVVPGAVQGSVRLLGDRLTGWAASTGDAPRAYGELFLFRDDVLVYRGAAQRSSDGQSPVPRSSFRIEVSRVGWDSADVRLFARVGPLASEIRLREAGEERGALAVARLVRDQRGRLRLETREGEQIRVTGGSMVGNVEVSAVGRGSLLIEGWAAQRDNRQPYAGLVVVAEGEPLAGAYERIDLPPISAQWGVPEALDYGFRLELPLAALGALESPRLRMFALAFDGSAGELQSDGRRLRSAVRSALADATR